MVLAMFLISPQSNLKSCSVLVGVQSNKYDASILNTNLQANLQAADNWWL